MRWMILLLALIPMAGAVDPYVDEPLFVRETCAHDPTGANDQTCVGPFTLCPEGAGTKDGRAKLCVVDFAPSDVCAQPFQSGPGGTFVCGHFVPKSDCAQTTDTKASPPVVCGVPVSWCTAAAEACTMLEQCVGEGPGCPIDDPCASWVCDLIEDCTDAKDTLDGLVCGKEVDCKDACSPGCSFSEKYCLPDPCPDGVEIKDLRLCGVPIDPCLGSICAVDCVGEIVNATFDVAGGVSPPTSICGIHLIDPCTFLASLPVPADPALPLAGAPAQAFVMTEGLRTKVAWDGCDTYMPTCTPTGPNGEYLDQDCPCMDLPPVPGLDTDGDRSFDWNDVDLDCDKLENDLEDGISWLDPQAPDPNTIATFGGQEPRIAIGIREITATNPSRAKLLEKVYLADASGPDPYFDLVRFGVGRTATSAITAVFDNPSGVGMMRGDHPWDLGWADDGSVKASNFVWPDSTVPYKTHLSQNHVEIPLLPEMRDLASVEYNKRSAGVPQIQAHTLLVEEDDPDTKRGADDPYGLMAQPDLGLDLFGTTNGAVWDVGSVVWSIDHGSDNLFAIDVDVASNFSLCGVEWSASLIVDPTQRVPFGAVSWPCE